MPQSLTALTDCIRQVQTAAEALDHITKIDLSDDERAEFRSIFLDPALLKMASVPKRLWTLVQVDKSSARHFVQRVKSRVRLPLLPPR